MSFARTKTDAAKTSGNSPTRRRPEFLRRLPVKRHTFISGVYFLCLRDDVVYVGQSTNLSSRISSGHNDKAYSRVYFIPCSPQEIGDLERFFISLLCPLYNKYHGQGDVRRGANLYFSTALVARCLNISVSEAKNLALDQALEIYSRGRLLDFLDGTPALAVAA